MGVVLHRIALAGRGRRLLEEINSYRATLELDSLVEVEQLSEAEQVYRAPFRDANTTKLPEREVDKNYNYWESNTKGWNPCRSLGLRRGQENGRNIYTLIATVPEGNAELRTILEKSHVFDDKACTDIGIAVVTINEQMYWTCTTFHKRSSPSPQA